MTHLFLSPHPDDAALSCGGQIALLAQGGQPVVIVTLFAGDPSAAFMALPPTAYAEKLWNRWGLGRGAVVTSARRAEDSAAAAALGVAIRFGDYAEAIYRLAAGRALYTDHAGIFGELHPDDPLWPLTKTGSPELADLIQWLALTAGDRLYVPLGVGHHVDHQLTRQIGQAIAAEGQIKAIAVDLRYYEEYPYRAQHSDAVTHALTDSHLSGRAVLHLIPLDTPALHRRIAAIGCYRSQLSSFWPDARAMAADIQRDVHQSGGERVWLIPPALKENPPMTSSNSAATPATDPAPSSTTPASVVASPAVPPTPATPATPAAPASAVPPIPATPAESAPAAEVKPPTPVAVDPSPAPTATTTPAASDSALPAASTAEAKPAAPLAVESTPAPIVTPAASPTPDLAIEAQLATMRDTFATLISEIVHGLRQPMTVLRGYSDMLSTPGMLGDLNEMQQQFAETIRANVISMDALLADVSDYNKLTSGRLRLEPKMTTYGQIVMDVQKQLEPLIEKLGRSPTWETPSGLPILVVDAKQVAKVMSKLISNALLYTPEGGTVTVKAERLPDNVLQIAVIDTGIGMTPEEIAKLGHLFFRGANEQVTAQKGYGMSMAVVTRLIPLMESKLEIDTTPDKGSTFAFTIVGVG